MLWVVRPEFIPPVSQLRTNIQPETLPTLQTTQSCSGYWKKSRGKSELLDSNA